MKKIKIGLLGGAFDPPTKSHMRIANKLLDILDYVMFMPCYVSYHDKKMTSCVDRLKMCHLACNSNSNNRIGVCSFEIRNKLTGESSGIMKKLLEEYKETPYEFYFVIGLDNANTLHTWGGADWLLANFKFITIPRLGYSPNPQINWFKQEPHIYLEDFEPDSGSSTQVRNEIKLTQTTSLVCDSVLEYINTNKFFL